jgi:hypothetical protein
MVAVPTGVASPRTAALVLAVLGYRRRLRRRDRWSRPALPAHPDRALHRLRDYAYQQSRFYQDFHAGVSSAPLSAFRYFVSATSGTTGTRASSCGTSGSGCRLSLPTIARSTGPAEPPAWLTESRQQLSAQPIPLAAPYPGRG